MTIKRPNLLEPVGARQKPFALRNVPRRLGSAFGAKLSNFFTQGSGGAARYVLQLMSWTEFTRFAATCFLAVGFLALGVPLATAAELPLRVEGLALDQVAISPNGDGRLEAVQVDFRTTATADVIVTVNAPDGTAVRTLWADSLAPGEHNFSWDGYADDGNLAADAMYTVTVDARVAGGVPVVGKARVRLDATSPVINLVKPDIRHRDDATLVSVPLTLSESALLRVIVEDGSIRRAYLFQYPGGAHALTMKTPVRWYGRREAGSYRILVSATDIAFNAQPEIAQRVIVYARPKPTPTWRPPPTGPVRFRWPLSAPITSGFGMRGGRPHEGVDLGAPTGRAIRAAARGRITIRGVVGGYGNLIEVRHANGFTTRYAHQSRFGRHRRGASVSKGALIGYVGSTGRSTGPHLHFEIRRNGVARNPLPYLP